MPSIGTPKYIKLKLPDLKGQREVNTTLSNGENRQRTKREAVDVSNAIDQRNLTDICKSLCWTTAECTFLSTCYMFSRVDQISSQCKRRNYSGYIRNSKDIKRLLWASLWQPTGQCRENGQVPRNIQLIKTATGGKSLSRAIPRKDIESAMKTFLWGRA